MNTAIDQFRMKIALIIEDHPGMIDGLTRQLEKLGFSVITANNGREGVKKATEENPDLILMDIIMPGMDGRAATRIIRSKPKTKDIPILAITALVRDSELRGCIKAGCNDYIVKPFTCEELQEKIQALILASREDGISNGDWIPQRRGSKSRGGKMAHRTVGRKGVGRPKGDVGKV